MTPHASRLFFLLVLCCLAGCTDKPKNSREQTAPVLTARVAQKVLPVQAEAIGHVEASATVTVKSQIGGMLQQVAFTAGQDVRKGDLLFKIDPRPQQTALQQAQGNLERDLARMRNAQADARRYQQLFRQGYVSRQQYELSDAEAKALQANVAADRAAVESARVQLEYCTIRSPLTGRTGDLLIDRGNVIKAIDENLALVTINQLRPIKKYSSSWVRPTANDGMITVPPRLKVRRRISVSTGIGSALPSWVRVPYVDSISR